MTVDQRIRRCILLEKMQKNKAYSEKLGLEDISTFKGKRVNDKEENKC